MTKLPGTASEDVQALNPELFGGKRPMFKGLKRERRNKYMAERVTSNGIHFASKAEARRYEELLLLQQAGEIRDLEAHPQFMLQEKFTDTYGQTHPSITYTADMRYRTTGQDHWVVEDVKGGTATATEAHRIRFKLAAKRYEDCEFREVRS